MRLAVSPGGIFVSEWRLRGFRQHAPVLEPSATRTVVAVSGGLGLIAVAPALLAYRRTQGHMAADAVTGGPST